MKVYVQSGSFRECGASLLALPLSKNQTGKKSSKLVASAGIATAVLDDFKAVAGEVMVCYPSVKKVKADRVALLGIGEGQSLDDWRSAAVAFASKAVDLKATAIAFDLSAVGDIAVDADVDIASFVSVIVESVGFGSYRFDRLKSGKTSKSKDKGKKKAERDDDKAVCIASLTILVNEDATAEARKGADAGLIVAEAQRMARDLVNLPGSHLQAADIANAAVESGSRHGYAVTVFGKEEIENLGMGGLLSVNRGSTNPPTFSVLEYKPKKKAKSVVALVGKGVSFDSGGISIKPAAGMDEMKTDMAGAASVIATLEAVSRLRLPLHVIGFIPSTDNMPDGNAMKPGDVITTLSGITVEVGNTDAEGRLILADALTYAKREYNPDVIIDVATLTGAIVIALGYSVAGLMSNDDGLAEGIAAAGDRSGEKVWRMPLWDLYGELVKSDIADVSNTGGRGGSSISAAKFLEKFIDGHGKWAHIDIAGTAYPPKGAPKSHGGTGFGVRLLVEYLKSLS